MATSTLILLAVLGLSALVTIVVVAACALSSQVSQDLELPDYMEEPAEADGRGYVYEEAV